MSSSIKESLETEVENDINPTPNPNPNLTQKNTNSNTNSNLNPIQKRHPKKYRNIFYYQNINQEFNDYVTEKMEDQDFMQHIYIVFNIVLELYRVVTSSLLVVFVPQDCGNGTICTLEENFFFKSSIIFNITLLFNYITLFSFFNVYAIEIIRENYLIKYLDVNTYLPNDDDDVAIKLNQLPKGKMDQILKLDTIYQFLCYVSMFIYFVNILLSSIVIRYNYLNTQSIYTFITYVLFIITKLNTIYTISTTKRHTFYSAYLKTFIQYNDIGHHHKPLLELVELADITDIIPEIEVNGYSNFFTQ